jgi:hypothetical protein
MGFKYYLNYFPLYRVGLHEALIRCISALQVDITLTLEFTIQIEKIFNNMFASSKDNKFHNLIFFVDLFVKVFDSPELDQAKQVFCLSIIFEKVTNFLNVSEFQHPKLLCLFMQELFHRKRFIQLLPSNEHLFNSLANSLEKKIMKNPLKKQNLSLFSLLLKLRCNYFDEKQILYDYESLQKISSILSENLFRLSSRDRLSALECFLDMPLYFYTQVPKYYSLCLNLGLFLLQRPRKSLYLIQRLIDKLYSFTMDLPEKIFFLERPRFFEVLMGCLSFQLSLSFEDRILLDAYFDSSLVNQAKSKVVTQMSKKYTKISKIGRLEQKEPLLARSNLFVYNLADFNIKFEGIFHQILLIFKHFENRSVSLNTRILSKSPSKLAPKLPTSFSPLNFVFSDLKLALSSSSLFSFFLASQKALKTPHKHPLFVKNEAFLYLSMNVLESISKMKVKEIGEYSTSLKTLMKPIFVQAFSGEKQDKNTGKGIKLIR